MTALVEVFGSSANTQDQNLRQLETEKQKQKKGGNTKLEFLMEKKKDVRNFIFLETRCLSGENGFF